MGTSQGGGGFARIASCLSIVFEIFGGRMPTSSTLIAGLHAQARDLEKYWIPVSAPKPQVFAYELPRSSEQCESWRLLADIL